MNTESVNRKGSPRLEWARKAVSALVINTVFATSIMIPANGVMAAESESIAAGPTGEAVGTWPVHAANPANWIGAIPRDNWRPVGSMAWNASGGFDLNMIDGERSITQARADTGTMGIASQEISDRIDRFPANSAYIFAAYSPETATLHIEVNRIEKRPDGVIYVEQAEFTPWHGEKWAAAGKYRTPAEVSFNQPGHNPFQRFKGATTDPIFRDISWDAAQVAIGHAMRNYNAINGFVAVSKSRFTTTTKKKGNILRKKVTTTVTGYTRPEWYVVTPVDMQPDGALVETLCVVSLPCDAPEHVAYSGVAVAKWDGGNMPISEEQVYQWIHTKKAWTVLAFMIILGPIYDLAVGSVLMNGGNLTDPQSKPFGKSGDGVLKPNFGSMSKQESGLSSGIYNKHVKPIQGHNLNSSQQLFKGACAQGMTVNECGAADAGTVWRADAYQETNMTLQMRDRFNSAMCSGFSGAARIECASPAFQ